ncbi:hypothetical protein K1719_020777 [Acacia pycnantha]|nr:hypothetical protein K1719_020777 [Acacia pycnantha]
MSPGLVTHVLSCLRRLPCSSLMLPLKYRSEFLVRSCLSAGLISIGDQVSASVPGTNDDDNKKINDHHPHEEDNIVNIKTHVSPSSDNEAKYMSSVRRFTFWAPSFFVLHLYF